MDNGNGSVIPAFAYTQYTGVDPTDVQPRIDWGFHTIPQAGAADGIINYPRGKTLGGSSARNYLVFHRYAIVTPTMALLVLTRLSPEAPTDFISNGRTRLATSPTPLTASSHTSSGLRRSHLRICPYGSRMPHRTMTCLRGTTASMVQYMRATHTTVMLSSLGRMSLTSLSVLRLQNLDSVRR